MSVPKNTQIDLEYLQLLELLHPGSRWRITYSEGSPKNKVIHIRAIVDQDQVVWKFWSRSRRVWRYEVKYIGVLWLIYKEGRLKATKVKRVRHYVLPNGYFSACGRQLLLDWAVTENEDKVTCRECIRCLGAKERRFLEKGEG